MRGRETYESSLVLGIRLEWNDEEDQEKTETIIQRIENTPETQRMIDEDIIEAHVISSEHDCIGNKQEFGCYVIGINLYDGYRLQGIKKREKSLVAKIVTLYPSARYRDLEIYSTIISTWTPEDKPKRDQQKILKEMMM